MRLTPDRIPTDGALQDPGSSRPIGQPADLRFGSRTCDRYGAVNVRLGKAGADGKSRFLTKTGESTSPSRWPVSTSRVGAPSGASRTVFSSPSRSMTLEDSLSVRHSSNAPTGYPASSESSRRPIRSTSHTSSRCTSARCQRSPPDRLLNNSPTEYSLDSTCGFPDVIAIDRHLHPWPPLSRSRRRGRMSRTRPRTGPVKQQGIAELTEPPSVDRSSARRQSASWRWCRGWPRLGRPASRSAGRGRSGDR